MARRPQLRRQNACWLELATLGRVDRLSSRTLIKLMKSGRNIPRRTEEGAVRVAVRPKRLCVDGGCGARNGERGVDVACRAGRRRSRQHDDFTPQQNQIGPPPPHRIAPVQQPAPAAGASISTWRSRPTATRRGAMRQIGLNYGVAPGLRTGVGVSLGDEADAGRPQADQRRRRAARAAGNHLQVLSRQPSIAAKPAQRPCARSARAVRRVDPAQRVDRQRARRARAARIAAAPSGRAGRGAGARKHRRERTPRPRRPACARTMAEPEWAAAVTIQRPRAPQPSGRRRRALGQVRRRPRRPRPPGRASAPTSSSKPRRRAIRASRRPRAARVRARRTRGRRPRRRAAGGAITASGSGVRAGSVKKNSRGRAFPRTRAGLSVRATRQSSSADRDRRPVKAGRILRRRRRARPRSWRGSPPPPAPPAAIRPR